MPAQVRARGVADAQFFDQGGIVQSALLQIVPRLGVAIELLLIEGGGLLEHSSRVSGRSALLLEVSEALAEGQMAGQLDKAKEIAALAATVTVKEIFVGVNSLAPASLRKFLHLPSLPGKAGHLPLRSLPEAERALGEDLKKLKQRLSLLDYLRQQNWVAQPAGHGPEFVGLCPLHPETRPSSLSVGGASSQEQCSTKRRRNA